MNIINKQRDAVIRESKIVPAFTILFYEKIVHKILIKMLIVNELKYQYRKQNDEASSVWKVGL